IQREGEAEAAAILAKGQAEARARQENAQAFKEYNEAAVIELVADILPELVRAASEPLSRIGQMPVVSTDGASQLVRDVTSNLEQGLAIGSSLTGVDLKGILTRIGAQGGLGGNGAGRDDPDDGGRSLPPPPEGG